jgi:hypothetical protein
MFLSDENKGVLWDLMKDNSKFQSEINKNVVTLKSNFEKTLEQIWNNNKNKDILELNKLFLMEMNTKLTEKRLITKKDIQQHRSSDFDSRLQKRQNDFDNSLKKNIPEEINFKDDYDEPLLDVERELEKKMEERKYDNVGEIDVDKVKEWIGIDISANDISGNEINTIHENITIEQEENFLNYSEEQVNNVFSKLKKVDDIDNVSNRVLLERLKRLERKLDMLIEYIQSK